MIHKRFIMVNTILLLILLLVSSDLISQATIQKYDFRNSRWGMKKDKVLSTEKNKPMGETPLGQYITLFYFGDIAGISATYVYLFLDDALVKGIYAIGSSTNSYQYINDYNQVKELMTKEYGSPIYSGS